MSTSPSYTRDARVSPEATEADVINTTEPDVSALCRNIDTDVQVIMPTPDQMRADKMALFHALLAKTDLDIREIFENQLLPMFKSSKSRCMKNGRMHIVAQLLVVDQYVFQFIELVEQYLCVHRARGRECCVHMGDCTSKGTYVIVDVTERDN